MGGMTVPGQHRPGRGVPTAMEPARRGRDDNYAAVTGYTIEV